MKYTEFNIDANKIEFLNSKFGLERVLINGKKISSKFSITGIAHKFKLNSKDYILKSKYTLFGTRVINIQLSENGKLIDTKAIEINKKQHIYWMAFGICVGLLGFELGKLLLENIG
ncbi:hypothetical protein LX77_03759 [Gelidibacter algens]|uniref:Uncharacterized protein n=1 Tax=Gelidibacter algens TaxID=49280 RepID=A0A1A7QUS6_9FLAO|nr:hypothetical protein [Gelidibacter algens]OBX23281.1 hypothetical protein A9996_16030 [Gelidibacter algens]RAJ18656.1 hypothetical protein LX77_03759 [Gelidibacter algens]